MGKKSKYFAVILTVMVICLSFAVLELAKDAGIASAADNTDAAQVSYSTVAVHDPSIVLAYEDENGNTYGEQNEEKTLTKVYFVFGTQIGNAKSYDMINWTSFTNNLNTASNLYALLGDAATYSGLTEETVIGNCWAPDVIWNRDLKKWTMYLSVNGPSHNSSIVMLMADSLNGNWSFAGTAVWSGFTNDNVGMTDYAKVMGTSAIDANHNVVDGSGFISYAAHAIDPSVFYDEDGQLWMVYGSWRGGIFLLKLDNYTGVRDYDYTYETSTKGSVQNGSTAFTVYSDRYFGKHIAGGAGISGEGPYIEYMNGHYYLFVSYGGYDPTAGYNMRYFVSDTVDGDYVDANGDSALYDHEKDDYGAMSATYGTDGIRVMSGYTWSWWDYSYIAQGHNSVFQDDDGKMYVVYHNKYTDGTAFHVMKVHELIDIGDGWLAAAPFEAKKETDSVALRTAESEVVGSYGAFVMTYNNGTYDNVCKESEIVLESGGTVSGAMSGSWSYDYNTAEIELTISGKTYTGYILNQTMEGTNIKTLSVTALDKTNGETFWAYKYPSEVTAGAYSRSAIAVPDKAQLGLLTDSFSTSDNIWYDTVLSMTKTGSGYSGSDGSTVTIENLADGYAQYDGVSYGQSFLAMPGIGNGFSISFDYSNYSSDWTKIFTGSNSRVYLSVLEYDISNTAVSVFEAAAVPAQYKEFAAEPYMAFYTTGTARATISVNSDYSISFYRDGIKMFTYSKGTAFNGSSYTIADLGASLVNDVKNGTLTSNYALSNVVIGAPLDKPLTGDVNITLTDSGTNVLYSAADNGAYNEFVAASYVSGATSSGVAVSFYIDTPVSAEVGDWESFVIKNESAFRYNITLPNLDTTDYRIRKWPEMTNLVNAGAYNAFLNTKGYVTVSVNTDGSVVYYMNGVKMVAYASDNSCSGDDGGSVGNFVSNLLSGIASSGFYFANGITGAVDLIVTNGLSDAQAMQIYKDYKAYAPEYFEERSYDYGDSGINVVYAPSGTYSASAFAPVSNAQSNGIAVSFQQNNPIPDNPGGEGAANNDWSAIAITSDRIRVTLPNLDPNFYEGGEGLTGTNLFPAEKNFYNGGAWNSFLNNETYYVTVSLNTDGSIVYYKDGVKVIAYAATDTLGNGTQVSTMVSVLLREIQNQGFGFGCSLFSANDITVTNAVNDSQALALYEYRNAAPEDHDCETDGHNYVLTRTGNSCEGFVDKYTCSYCSDSYEAVNLNGVTGHDYVLAEDVDSTCTVAGHATYRCSVCNDEVTAVKPLAEHKTDGTWHYDETGVEKGHWQLCSMCGQKVDKSSDHNYGAGSVIEEATCTAPGKTQYTCTVCGAKLIDETRPAATGHDHSGEWVSNDANHWKICANDGCDEMLDAGEHEWDEGVVTLEPTCVSEGEKTFTCAVCEATKTEPVQATGVHTLQHVEEKQPTCEVSGNKEYWYCEVCDGYFGDASGETETTRDDVTINAVGHSYTSATVQYDEKMTSEWTVNVHCDNGCGKDLVLTVPAIGDGGWTLDTEEGYVAPTHTEDGKGAYYRTVTQDGHNVLVRVENVVIKTNAEHVYPDTLTFTADEYTEGEKTVGCIFEGCQASVTVQLPALDADGWNETVVTEATCQTEGKKTLSRTVTASNDKQITVNVSDVVIEKIAHALTKVPAKDPTCEESGNKEYWYCELCKGYFGNASGETETTRDDVTINAVGHSYTSATVQYGENMTSEWTVNVNCDNGCGKDLVLTVPAIGDGGWTLDTEEGYVAPTHTEDGEGAYYRTVTQDGYNVLVRVERVTIAADADHVFDTSLTYEAEAYTAGEKTLNCTYVGCDVAITVTLPELSAEDWTENNVTAATCESDGSKTLTAVFEASNGADVTVTVNGVVIDALGHNYVFDKTVKPDFAGKTDGYDVYVCENDPSHTEHRNPVEWETLGVTVTFDSNGGSAVSSVFVEKGGAAGKLASPTRNGHVFGGWYVDGEFGTEFTATTKVNANMTVYARWLVNVIETDDDEEVEIKVESPEGFEEDVRITVVDKTAESEFTVSGKNVDKVYEVSANAALSGEMTVSIYVGEGFDSLKNSVYTASENGVLTEMEYVYEDGYVTLNTDKLGTFVFASAEAGGEDDATIVPGDDTPAAVIVTSIICAVIAVAAIAAVIATAVIKKKRV